MPIVSSRRVVGKTRIRTSQCPVFSCRFYLARPKWRLLPIKIRSKCTTYSFAPPAKRYRRSPPILSTWAPRLVFSACCILGAQPSLRTLTQYVRHYHLLDFSV